jgi:3-hydroxy-9,10-secoandrosta-1,3,5(10)-triene-9,17-dione monooxygenase reductase component
MVTRDLYRHVIGHFATGVAIITTLAEDGSPKGFTATAIASLSLDPPRILVCVDTGSQTYPALRDVGSLMAINLLADDHQPAG